MEVSHFEIIQVKKVSILIQCYCSTPYAPLGPKDDSLLSSDLSIELSHHEELLPILSFQEDEESADEDDDELPSFQMQMDKSK